MAYARTLGKQVAIVHGTRDPVTRRVEQQTLYTFYARTEILEILDPRGGIDPTFRDMLAEAHPEVRFNWGTLRDQLGERISHLPERYRDRGERLAATFEADMIAFARQVALAGQASSPAMYEAVLASKEALEGLQTLLAHRLTWTDEKAGQWQEFPHHQWRARLQTNDAPWDLQDWAVGFYERGEHDVARRVFGLLVDCFDRYAEGHHYLGLIAWWAGEHADAAEHFRRTVEVGRAALPARVPKGRWWRDLATRPVIRGLRSMAATLPLLGRDAEALTACDELEHGCEDGESAEALRIPIWLGQSRWSEARQAALRLRELWPAQSLNGAIAAFELGEPTLARELFLHGMLNAPAQAALLAGKRGTPTGHAERPEDVEGYRASLGAYLGRRRPKAKRFFAAAWDDGAAPRQELSAAEARWFGRSGGSDRADFEAIQRLQASEFARAWARANSDESA